MGENVCGIDFFSQLFTVGIVDVILGLLLSVEMNQPPRKFAEKDTKVSLQLFFSTNSVAHVVHTARFIVWCVAEMRHGQSRAARGQPEET